MKRVAILGSTGSIGTQALSIIEKNRDRFAVHALATNRNIGLLSKQIERYSPKKVVVFSEKEADELRGRLKGSGPEVLTQEDGLFNLSEDKDVDILLVAMTGIKGLPAIINALKNRKKVALANKESLVSAGRFVVDAVRRYGGEIIPVDSEHSAVFRLIKNTDRGCISRIILTATGGPFRGKGSKYLRGVKMDEVLRHPRWKMGRKVTVDSATMVNKAFEMIEARWLFDLSPDELDVVIHPQALVHSLVQLSDGSFFAHLGPADMRIPIGYALSYPDRLDNILKVLNLRDLEEITFEGVRPPFKHPIDIARRIISEDVDKGIVFNAADEVAVESFLEGRIEFVDIIRIIDYSLKHFRVTGIKSVMDVINFDGDIKDYLKRYIEKRYR
jgi:1-deoxy-D-xylulose-5-phosphate reductoisomerase